jgi:hypothetical protein
MRWVCVCVLCVRAQALHQNVLDSVAGGVGGLGQRERDLAAQREAAEAGAEGLRQRLAAAPALAEDSLLLVGWREEGRGG